MSNVAFCFTCNVLCHVWRVVSHVNFEWHITFYLRCNASGRIWKMFRVTCKVSVHWKYFNHSVVLALSSAIKKKKKSVHVFFRSPFSVRVLSESHSHGFLNFHWIKLTLDRVLCHFQKALTGSQTNSYLAEDTGNLCHLSVVLTQVKCVLNSTWFKGAHPKYTSLSWQHSFKHWT